MTNEELDALPECNGITSELREINGVMMHVPVEQRPLALFDPMLVHDRTGRAWMVGRAGGVTYKSRMRQFDV